MTEEEDGQWRFLEEGETMRGDAIVFDEAFDITMPGWSPEQLALDKIRQVPEARLIAALQVPAMVVGLSVGDGQRTYSNMREAREMAYESSILPLLSVCNLYGAHRVFRRRVPSEVNTHG